jgi:hypothetical protein
VFEGADNREIMDEAGNLYGALPEGQSLRFLGTRWQQVAKFPLVAVGQPWHGYPVWPVGEDERNRPPKTVLNKMTETGLISASMRRRLMKGDHV